MLDHLPAHAHAHERAHLRASTETGARASERGFTLIEILVVIVIIVIITGFSVGTVRNSRSNGDKTQARSTARALAEGIDQFQRDHAGRLPGPPGSADWRPPTGGGALSWRSPVDSGNGDRPYVKASSIEPLVTGVVNLQSQSGQVEPGGRAKTRIVYNAANGVFALVVMHDRDGSGMKADCYVTTSHASVPSTLRGGLDAARLC